MAKYEQNESYGIAKDNFEGPNVCVRCPKLDETLHCTVYSADGTMFRVNQGYCPASNRWADWRIDKPVVVKGKKRIGQQKQQ